MIPLDGQKSQGIDITLLIGYKIPERSINALDINHVQMNVTF